MTSIQIEKRKLYAIDLSLLSLKTIFLSFARSDDHQTVSWIQFISQAWQTTNVEKCEYFSVWIELAQPSISWAAKHVKRRKAPSAERGVKERKNGFTFFLTAVDNFIQRPYQRRELNLFPVLCPLQRPHINYGQGLIPRALRRMFYGQSSQAGSWKIHRHNSLLCVGIHVYERISYTALSEREACFSKENREIQSNTKCYSVATYCKWPFYALERKKSLLKAQLLH